VTVVAGLIALGGLSFLLETLPENFAEFPDLRWLGGNCMQTLLDAKFVADTC
jgi:hypothetical protein